MHVFEAPAPYPTATLFLPDSAGEVRIRVLKVKTDEYVASHFFVEMPVWDGWSSHVNGREVSGIAPRTLTMWAPSAAVELGPADRSRVMDLALDKMAENGECLA